MLEQITPIILTFNEQDNIERTLSVLKWAKEVLIIDSGSTDETLNICSHFENVRLINRPFDNFAGQCNFALKQDIKTEWVLSMDADYVLTSELVSELQELQPSNTNGYKIAFQYLISGKPLSGSLYPPRTALYRKNVAYYQQDGHAHKVLVDGTIGLLKEKIQHDDRKPFKRWFGSQQVYAQHEATKLSSTTWAKLSAPDKLRKLGLAPLIILPYTLFIKGLIVNGWPGFVYCGQRLVAELVLQFARVKKLFKNLQ